MVKKKLNSLDRYIIERENRSPGFSKMVDDAYDELRDKKPILLIDMDLTLVEMLGPWLKRYNELCETDIKVTDVQKYDMGLACPDEKTLYSILEEPDFFYNMEPMPGAQKYFQQLMNEGYDIVIATQPPRKSDYAIRDKRRWMKKYFPDFELSNMIFLHRKELLKGDVLFDDNPTHLNAWIDNNPYGRIATLDWPWTKDVVDDFRGSLENGWEGFYEWVKTL